MGRAVVERLLWAKSWENDFPHVSPNRETEVSGMKGAKEATHLGRDPAGIPLLTNHVGWLCVTHCPTLPGQGAAGMEWAERGSAQKPSVRPKLHVRATAPFIFRLFLRTAKEHNGMFYTSPPSPTPLPCPSAPHHRERRELNADRKGGKEGQGPDNHPQIIKGCPGKSTTYS